jgi:hypothetical protein
MPARRATSWLASNGAVPQLAVVLCVVIAAFAAVIRYPLALSDLNATADRNSEQSYADREIAGGNAVVPDQQLAYEARGRIPEDATYEVVVGQPLDDWSPLTADHVAGYVRYFLMPRRPSAGAPWILCLNCNVDAYPGDVVWSGDGMSIIRRTG